MLKVNEILSGKSKISSIKSSSFISFKEEPVNKTTKSSFKVIFQQDNSLHIYYYYYYTCLMASFPGQPG